jgi:2,3-bisphosphoglycerate-independent phosphoglycerate mutase
MNFRADRAQQLSQALINTDFDAFHRTTRARLQFVTTTEYSSSLACPVAYPPDGLESSLGEVLSEQGLTQLRLAETEKYAHVTFSSAVDEKRFFRVKNGLSSPLQK